MDLNGYIALYIPSKNAEGRDIAEWKRNDVLKTVRKVFAKAFGGYTACEAEGGWVGDKGLVKEDITVVKAFHNLSSDMAFDYVKPLAVKVKKNLNQEAVTIEQNGGISFI